MIVTLSIVLVAFVPLSTVLFAAMRTSTVAANRTRAAALASRDTESYHALPYCAVGYTIGAGAGQVPAT